MLDKYLKNCKKCGHNGFDINEFVVHRAILCEKDGDLTVYTVKNNGIELIICSECKEEYYESDFKQINF